MINDVYERGTALLEARGDAYLFDRKEVAMILGLSLASVIRYAERGLLPEHRLPSARGTRSFPRYERSAIEAFRDSGYTRPRSRS